MVTRYYAKIRNHKKAAQLIKEFGLDLKTINQEFFEIEEAIIADSMNFYCNQFGVSFKHYSIQNVLRLADFLVDHSPQQYGKPIAFLIEKLIKHDLMDEAKQIYNDNMNLVDKWLSQYILDNIIQHEIEYEVEPI